MYLSIASLTIYNQNPKVYWIFELNIVERSLILKLTQTIF